MSLSSDVNPRRHWTLMKSLVSWNQKVFLAHSLTVMLSHSSASGKSHGRSNGIWNHANITKPSWSPCMHCHSGTMLPYSDKRKQVTNHQNLRKWCFYIRLSMFYFQSKFWAETLILLKDIFLLSQDIMIFHWCQCTWQTHFAHLR